MAAAASTAPRKIAAAIAISILGTAEAGCERFSATRLTRRADAAASASRVAAAIPASPGTGTAAAVSAANAQGPEDNAHHFI